jgi:hypothetical protein
MKRTTQYTVTFGPRDTGPFLDMLRYDGARVITWDHTHDVALPESRRGERFSVTLEVENRQPSIERWASFGITAKVVS